MDDNERNLFHQLIVASQNLVTVSRNAATVLSVEYESMITGPADIVQGILDQCPVPESEFDGTFREEDCDEEHFAPDFPVDIRDGRVNTGVKLTHKPTGMAVEAYQAPELQVNRRRAMSALKARVEARFPPNR